MNSSVLAYLENSAEYFPEKCAVTDEKFSYSYSELVKLSSSVGTALSELITLGDAVGIYMEKCADAVAAFFATVYAGGFYSVLNTELPQNRLQTTVSVLNPKVIVTSESLLETAKEYFSERKVTVQSCRCPQQFQYLWLFIFLWDDVSGFATIGLVPRLKLERKWPLELQGTSLGLMLRTVPYVVCSLSLW